MLVSIVSCIWLIIMSMQNELGKALSLSLTLTLILILSIPLPQFFEIPTESCFDILIPQLESSKTQPDRMINLLFQASP